MAPKRVSKMKVLILSQNFEFYTGGYYHQDWINAFSKLHECDIYGPGYPLYDSADSIDDVFSKFNNKYELIVASTSWDKPGQLQNDGDVNIHPNIDLSNINNIPKIYFLNKEYINLDSKLAYAVENKFNYILTVLNQNKFSMWEKKTNIKFIQTPFAVDFQRVTLGRDNYDFSFSGALHSSYTDRRYLVKKEVFNSKQSILQKSLFKICSAIFPKKNWDFLSSGLRLPSNIGIPRILSLHRNPITRKAQHLKIYWAERHIISKDYRMKDLLPFGKEYFELLSSSKTFLCTLSAEGIIGPRFYELMASRSVIICPVDEYDGLLIDGYNCVMYKNESEIVDIITELKADDNRCNMITDNAYSTVQSHTYETRVSNIIEKFYNN
jgi:glycosyltransferase involved in cell wall biosynthesis